MGRRSKIDCEKTYFYNGQYLTVHELMQYSQGISVATLASRLEAGWDPEKALHPAKAESDINEKELGKDLLVAFRKPLGGVFSNMQPILNKPYVAHRNKQIGSKLATKHFFVVNLENGKQLIVYPFEFEILGEAPAV